jgi:hypothetical protein
LGHEYLRKLRGALQRRGRTARDKEDDDDYDDDDERERERGHGKPALKPSKKDL